MSNLSYVIILAASVISFLIFYRIGKKQARLEAENGTLSKVNESNHEVEVEREKIRAEYNEKLRHYPDNWDDVNRMQSQASSGNQPAEHSDASVPTGSGDSSSGV